MRYLRTNTAIRLTVGPFFDQADGVTPETSLTVTNCKLTLMVDDSNVPTLVLDASATGSGGNNDMIHVAGDDAGFYDLELTAANLNYLGRAMLAITDATNHCPVFHEFMILPAMIYDSIVLGSDRLDTNVTHVTDTAQDAANIHAKTLKYFQLALRADAAIATDNATEKTAINANGGSGGGSFDNTLPSTTDVIKWLGTAVSVPTVAGVPNMNCKTWNDLATVALPLVPTTPGTTLDVTAGGNAGIDWGNVANQSTGVTLSGTTVGLVTLTSTASAVTTVNGLAADVITATSLATNAVTEIQTGLATSSAQTTAQTSLTALQADNPNVLTKNVALSNFMFKMVGSTDHRTGATGVTVTATRSLDGAAFGACANSVSEVSNGWYKINLDATDTNANVIVLRFTATSCDPTEMIVLSQPT